MQQGIRSSIPRLKISGTSTRVKLFSTPPLSLTSLGVSWLARSQLGNLGMEYHTFC